MSTLKTNSITHISNSGTANLSLDSSGNVGIGTASPNSFTNYTTLTINGGSDGAGIDLELSDNNIYGRLFGDTSGLQIQSAQSGDAIRFQTNGANERMRITSDGKVGIGTSSPAEKLDVNGNINLPTINTWIKGGGHSVLQVDATMSYLYGGSGGAQFRSADNSTALIQVLNDGKVGIGTTSPARLLTIYGDTGIALQNSTTGTGTGNGTHIWGSGNDLLLQNREAGNIRFYTSDQEKLRINSDGNIGIGLTDPQVYYAEDLVLKCAAAEGGITVRSSGANQTNYLMFADGTSGNERYRGYIGYAHNTGASGGEHMQFAASGNTVARLYAGGLILNGTDTADANKLHDYEEGTWDPTVAGWDTFTPYTGSNYDYGWYVKIGGLVYFGWKIYIQGLSTLSTSGSGPHIRFTGLPFTSKDVTSQTGPKVRFDIPEFGTENYVWSYIGGNDTTVYMYSQASGAGSSTAMNATANRSNCWTMAWGVYRTDS